MELWPAIPLLETYPELGSEPFLFTQLPQCGRPGFDPWVGKISWRKKRLPTPVFWPREFHGLYSPWGHRVGHNWENFTPFSINNNPLLCGTLGLPTVPSCGPNGDLPTVTVGWYQANLSSLQVFPKLELRTKIQLCFGGFFMFLFYIGSIVD